MTEQYQLPERIPIGQLVREKKTGLGPASFRLLELAAEDEVGRLLRLGTIANQVPQTPWLRLQECFPRRLGRRGHRVFCSPRKRVDATGVLCVGAFVYRMFFSKKVQR